MRPWHASISRNGVSQPTLLNTSSTLDSKSSLDTPRGIPTTSKHFPLEYWAFARALPFHINYPLVKEFVYLLDKINFRLKLNKVFIKLTIFLQSISVHNVVCFNFFWSDKAIPIISLDNLSNVLSVYAAIVESFFSYR